MSSIFHLPNLELLDDGAAWYVLALPRQQTWNSFKLIHCGNQILSMTWKCLETNQNSVEHLACCFECLHWYWLFVQISHQTVLDHHNGEYLCLYVPQSPQEVLTLFWKANIPHSNCHWVTVWGEDKGPGTYTKTSHQARCFESYRVSWITLQMYLSNLMTAFVSIWSSLTMWFSWVANIAPDKIITD